MKYGKGRKIKDFHAPAELRHFVSDTLATRLAYRQEKDQGPKELKAYTHGLNTVLAEKKLIYIKRLLLDLIFGKQQTSTLTSSSSSPVYLFDIISLPTSTLLYYFFLTLSHLQVIQPISDLITPAYRCARTLC